MGKLKCPLCGDYTSFSPVLLKGKGVLTANSREYKTAYADVALEALAFDCGEAAYAILECKSCYKCFVAEARPKYSGNWAAVYPIPHKPVSEDIPEPIRSQFEEAHLCFAVGAYGSCLLMCGSALEASWREQRVSGLQDLKDKGVISPSLYNQANEVRLWGNVVQHDQPMPQVVTEDDAEQLLTYLEAILNAIYIEPKRLAALAQKRAQLKKKQ
jgi:hypothetical protein